MTRRAWTLAGGAAALAAALAVAGGAIVASGEDDEAQATPETPATTATVREGKLASAVSLNGTLTYRAQAAGSPYAAINRASGVYTRLPAAGDVVKCGDVLYRVDDAPVLLLCGTVPAYRDLAIGDEGRDVRQLHRNLHRLGYDDADPGEDAFTWRTREAVEALQHDLGVEQTGKLDRGDVVVLPTAGRVAAVAATLGTSARPGTQVTRLTSDRLEVQVQLEPSQQRVVRRGDRARITLPDNRSAGGRVERVARVAQSAEEDGPATIPASIALDRPAQARGLDRAAVQVEIATEGVERALSVPVTALVGKAGGGFAVEVVRGGGRRELVAVELGLFDTAGGRVEVDGGVRAGDRVVVPTP